MRTTNNTVLIIGGSAGIGFEVAKQFSQKGNHVIITGRNEQRLKKAAAQLQNVTAIAFDVTSENDVNRLVKRMNDEFPKLNVVINNAGHAAFYNMTQPNNAFEQASAEMLTNYLSIVRLNEDLIPLLRKQTEAAIVNVSSIVAFAPSVKLAGYGATKAALHSYSQSLRLALQSDSAIKVFELMPPLVNTEFSKEIGGANGISPAQVADELLIAMEKEVYEVHVGGTAQFYQLYLSSPNQALQTMNGSR